MSHVPDRRSAARERLAREVGLCRGLNPLGVPDWDADTWTLPDRASGTRADKARLRFRLDVTRKREGTPFPHAFAHMAKCFLCDLETNRPGKTLANRYAAILGTLKVLLASLEGRDSDPAGLRRIDFENAKRAMLSSTVTAYERATVLTRLAAYLDEKGLIADPLRWSSDLGLDDGRKPISAPPGTPGSGAAVAKAASIGRSGGDPDGKACDDTVIFALADLSNRTDLDDRDLLCQRVVELMIFSAKRLNETLSAPRAFLVRRAIGPLPELDGEAAAMRFWPGRNCPVRPTWIASDVLPVVERALADVLRITDPSWRIADHQKRHPGRTLFGDPWDALEDGEMLALTDIARILFDSGSNSLTQKYLEHRGARLRPMPSTPRKRRARGTPLGITKGELAEICRKESYTSPVLPVLDPTIGLSDLLFVVPAGFMRSHPVRAVATTLTDGAIRAYLSGKNSIFVRRDLRDHAGAHIRMTPRQTRHWMSTMLERGGLSPMQLAHWIGRRDASVHSTYSHIDPKLRAARVRTKLEAGEGGGLVPDAVRSMPFDARRPGARSAIPVMRPTGDVGSCSRDFSSAPCLRDGECLGCAHHWSEKGDREDVAKLRTTVETLRWFLDACRVQGLTLQAARYQTRLVAAEAMLAMHDDPAVPDGAPLNTMGGAP